MGGLSALFDMVKTDLSKIAPVDEGFEDKALGYVGQLRFVADLHIHSHFSTACSRKLIPEYLAQWAQLKGIDLVGTGDFTHPLWSREIKANFEEAGEGLYRVKGQNSPLFILNTEVSSIYSQGGKLRRIHNLIFAPNNRPP